MAIILAFLLASSWFFFLSRYFVPLRRLRQNLSAILQGADRDLSGLDGASAVRKIAGQITELIEENNDSEQRARDEGLNLTTILSSMREGVVLLDNQRRIRLANEAIYRLLPAGLSPINRTLLEIFRNHILQRAIEASFASPEPQTTEYIVDVYEDEKLIAKTLEVTSIGMTGRNGEIVGALAVFHDLTRIKGKDGVSSGTLPNGQRSCSR